MWGESKRIGDCLFVSTKEIPMIVFHITIDNMNDTIRHGFWKRVSQYTITKKTYSDESMVGWSCMVLPISSMESFQFHIGTQFDKWFSDNDIFLDGGKAWKKYLSLRTKWRLRRMRWRLFFLRFYP